MQEKEIRKYAVDVLEQLWLCIDFDNMSNTRKMNIWDEFSGKVRACANSSRSFEIFIEKMAKKIDSRSFDGKAALLSEISNFEESDKKAVLKMYREQLSIIILELRLKREEEKEKFKKKSVKIVENTISDEEAEAMNKAFSENVLNL